MDTVDNVEKDKIVIIETGKTAGNEFTLQHAKKSSPGTKNPHLKGKICTIECG